MSGWLLLAQALEYPTPALLDVLEGPAIRDAAVAGPLSEFRALLASQGCLRLQEAYTAVFDFSGDTAPYLGHHLFGEDMRRGAFMAHLKKRFAETGLAVPATEVPDHLSVVLRFLDRLDPGEEADELVRDCLRPATVRLRRALERQGSPYALVLQALDAGLQATTGEAVGSSSHAR